MGISAVTAAVVEAGATAYAGSKSASAYPGNGARQHAVRSAAVPQCRSA
ncbi:MAG TPA: hypothetical protein VNR89_22640 [Roseomonas sp.]|nr:hypothetical protein [Roseomonas sp.]